jgi:hypothetical protein
MKTLLFQVFLICIAFKTVAQQPGAITGFFAGSIPCDDWIKSELKITQSTPCEFQKWELTLDNNQFSLKVRYGISKPNTNGFENEGTLMEVAGTYSFRKSPDGKKIYYELNSSKFKMVLKLLRLDDNVFHIVDDAGTLLVGNGGFSYSLNRIRFK